MKKWEYQQKVSCSLHELNLMGSEGWELVHVQRDDTSRKHWFYFKREKV